MAYKSGFERKIAKRLTEQKAKFKYEDRKIKFIQPAKNRTYTPDFFLPNGIIIEAKGKLDAATRLKMVLIKKQHPDLDIRFVFMKAGNRIRKGSKTTYGSWATANGFMWADGEIPEEWLNE